MEYEHIPVLKDQLIDYLNPVPGGTYVDCTVGGGGHAEAVAKRVGEEGHIVGIDRDPAALSATAKRLAGYPAKLTLIHANFASLQDCLIENNVIGGSVDGVDGIVFDLGVSSYQLDQPERGFTYRDDAPLDMRMNPDQQKTAADLVNELSQQELARIIREYGEERWAARIASFIVKHRQRERVETTGHLVEIIKQAIPARARRRGPHPARRTFQALRIAVNEELESLKQGLYQAVEVLNPGGRMCIISFHSLEDRIVKHTLRELATGCICPPRAPVCTCNRNPKVKILTRKPVLPTAEEIEANPRARSAKMRVCERVLRKRGTE